MLLKRARRRAHVVVPELETEELPDLLGAVLSSRAFLFDQRQHGVAAQYPRPHELAVDEHVVDEFAEIARDPRAQRRTEGCFRAGTRSPWAATTRRRASTRPCRSDLRSSRVPGKRERGPHDLDVDERDAHLRRGRHARSVGVREVEPGQEEPRVRETHAVHVIGQRGVLVDRAVLVDDVVDEAARVRDRAAPASEPSSYKRVAAAERRFLRQIREREEPFRPPRRAASRGRRRRPGSDRPRVARCPFRSVRGSRRYRAAPITQARCLRYPPKSSSAPMPESSTFTPASRAASQMSSVLIAAGSPIGSSSMSTMRGSMSVTSGAISISCRAMP